MKGKIRVGIGGWGIDTLTRGRQEALQLRPQFMRPQLLHRSKNYAPQPEIVEGSAD